MDIPENQIKKGNKIIMIKQSQMKKGWSDYNIKKHSKTLISTTNDTELEYIMIKRKKFLIILDNEISNNQHFEPESEPELTETTKDINNEYDFKYVYM